MPSCSMEYDLQTPPIVAITTGGLPSKYGLFYDMALSPLELECIN
jgi:hypothetical protein